MAKKIDKTTIIAAIITGVSGVIAGAIGGNTYTNMALRNYIQTTSNVEVNVSNDSAYEIAKQLLDSNEKMTNEIAEYKQEIETSNKEIEEYKQEIEAANKEIEELKEKLEKGDQEQNNPDVIPSPVNPSTVTYLTDLEMFNNVPYEWKVNYGDKKDVFGEVYSSAATYCVIGDNSTNWRNEHYDETAEYYLPDGYTKLSGTIAPHISTDADGYASIQVFGQKYIDGQLSSDIPLYSTSIDKKTPSLSFSTKEGDMEGIAFLKIHVQSVDANALFVDWKLEK